VNTLQSLQSICSQISFEGMDLHCGDDGIALWLQWVFFAPCAETGEACRQSGRKWRVSHYATPDEVVKTAFAAVLFALEHEARETFTYRGETIFHPHTDVEALVELAQQKRYAKRQEVKS
jgi:hypothetical protein